MNKCNDFTSTPLRLVFKVKRFATFSVGILFAFLAFGFLIYGTYISVISDFVSRIQNLYMPHYKCYMWNGSFVFCVLNSLTTQSLSCFPVATTYDWYRTQVMYVHAKGTIKCT